MSDEPTRAAGPFVTARAVKRAIDETLADVVKTAGLISGDRARTRALLAQVHEDETGQPPRREEDLEAAAMVLQATIENWSAVQSVLPRAKLIQFDGDQGEILLHAGESYTDTLEYRLPFPATLLTFTRPIPIQMQSGQVDVVALLLQTEAVTRAALRRVQDEILDDPRFDESDVPDFVRAAGPDDEVVYLHESAAFYRATHTLAGLPRTQSPLMVQTIAWQTGQVEQQLLDGSDWATQVNQSRILALACIGYINAENIRLARIAGGDAKTNAKRAAKGKRPIEDYYVCKVRGVNYDSQGREVDASGRHVSYRFDVRGHFRKLASGKVTWVRPHQRGLDHERYIPKTYVVERQPDA